MEEVYFFFHKYTGEYISMLQDQQSGKIIKPLERRFINQKKKEEMNRSRQIQEYLCGYKTYKSNVWNSKRRVQASTQNPWWTNNNKGKQGKIIQEAWIYFVAKETYP